MLLVSTNSYVKVVHCTHQSLLCLDWKSIFQPYPILTPPRAPPPLNIYSFFCFSLNPSCQLLRRLKELSLSSPSVLPPLQFFLLLLLLLIYLSAYHPLLLNPKCVWLFHFGFPLIHLQIYSRSTTRPLNLPILEIQLPRDNPAAQLT